MAMACLSLPNEVHAICGLDAAFTEQVRILQDPAAAEAWSRRLAVQGGAACTACHIAGYGPRNRYGSAINVLLSSNDREDAVRKREAGRRVAKIPANPSLPDSPTFGDLVRRGVPPASDSTTELPTGGSRPAAPDEIVTVEQARELVGQVQAESSFGILQLSRAHEMNADVAAVLAEFHGEMLILGLKTLTPDVARALASSRAATVWLHSITAVTPEAAEAIAALPGHLVLSGLVELDSLPLARKLARRPATLSLPYLKRVGPEIAAALGENRRGLMLAGLTDVSIEVQDSLAQSFGSLTLPNLEALSSLPLTRKLAEGFASSVLLPRIKTLSVEQAEAIASVNRPFFLGGVFLPLTVMTEEVATVFAKNPAAGRLKLGGGAISDPPFRILVQSPVSVELREVDSFNDEQVRILATAADRVPGGPFGTQPKIVALVLTTLDSPLLATTLLRCSGGFPGVTAISPGAAAALGSMPAAETDAASRAGLSFPSLEELSPETARLLMSRPWTTISMPALRQASPETVRSLARRTTSLTLGIGTMTPEVASAFGEMASNQTDLGGGQLSFPCLTELSPEAARNLVSALNRGKEVPVWGGLDRSPQLFIGGRGLTAVCPPLTAALAGELAKYRGRLSIAGLRDLSPDAAAALVSYRGPSLDLSGPATDKLDPETAAALANFSGNLEMPLKVLDSVPLAEKFARQSQRTLDGLEFISAEAIPAWVNCNGFFTLRQLTVLDDPAVTKTLTKSRKAVRLPRLRATTPDVLGILNATRSIITPPLESLHLLPRRPVDGGRVDSDDFPLAP